MAHAERSHQATKLEEISGQSCGLHKSPGIMLADTPERMEFLKMTVAAGAGLFLHWLERHKVGS